jgi:hypothetical protein
MVFADGKGARELYERVLVGTQLQEPQLRSRHGSDNSGGQSLQLNECSNVYSEQIVARASAMYQLQGACTKLQISHLEGFCDKNDNLYRAGVDMNHIGCEGGLCSILKRQPRIGQSRRCSFVLCQGFGWKLADQMCLHECSLQ